VLRFGQFSQVDDEVRGDVGQALAGVAGGQLCYFNAIESVPIGLAVLLEYLGVVLVVGCLWAIRGQRPGRLTAAGVLAAIAGLALLAGLAGPGQLSPAGIM
jgi:drug/metabolite transporter (DMT)-like permease